MWYLFCYIDAVFYNTIIIVYYCNIFNTWLLLLWHFLKRLINPPIELDKIILLFVAINISVNKSIIFISCDTLLLCRHLYSPSGNVVKQNTLEHFDLKKSKTNLLSVQIYTDSKLSIIFLLFLYNSW